jgi:hypothetical protein
MDVEGAAMQDYLSQLKALEDKGKPSLTFSNLNDILGPIEKYAKENGSAAGAAEIAQEAINLRLLYGKDPSAAIAGAEALAKGISSDTKYVSIKAVDSAEAKLAQVEKSLTDDLAKPLPTTEADILARTENSRVFKNNLNILKEELAALSFSAGSDVGKKRDAIIGRINGIIEDYYDPENGEYSPAKYVTLRTAETVANETAADKAPLAKLAPLVSFLDEPTQKNVMTAVSIGSKLTNEGMGYIDNPAISSKITGQMVNNGLNGLASSTGNLQASIKNNPEGHLASFIDVTAPFTYEVYTDKAKTSRVYVPASEFMSASSGVLPRIARSLVPNGYVDKLYNESGQPEAVDITLSALVTRASETMYRELGKTNLPNVSYTKQDGTVMSSSEVLRTYFAPVDYKSHIASYYEQGSPKTFKLSSSGEPVLLRPNTRLTALPASEQKKLFAVWDAYNAEAERRYPVGVESFTTIFYKLNDRVTGGGTE